MERHQNPDGTWNGVTLMAELSGLSEAEIAWTWKRLIELKKAGHDKKTQVAMLREEGQAKPWVADELRP